MPLVNISQDSLDMWNLYLEKSYMKLNIDKIKAMVINYNKQQEESVTILKLCRVSKRNNNRFWKKRSGNL